jgi:hypothetical protein
MFRAKLISVSLIKSIGLFLSALHCLQSVILRAKALDAGSRRRCF